MNVIDDAVTALKALAALDGFDIRDFEDLPDKPAKPTLCVGFVDYKPADNAQGTLRAQFRFTLISQLEDRRKAQKQIDGTAGTPGLLVAVLRAVRDTGFVMTRTAPVLIKDTFTGYAIEAWATTESPY